MSFHIFNLGLLGASLQRYADKDGFIPEKEDHWQEFNWPKRLHKQFADKETGEGYWQDFQAKAIAATIKAEQALENLTDSQVW